MQLIAVIGIYQVWIPFYCEHNNWGKNHQNFNCV